MRGPSVCSFTLPPRKAESNPECVEVGLVGRSRVWCGSVRCGSVRCGSVWVRECVVREGVLREGVLRETSKAEGCEFAGVV